jgi:hypothetical protein
MERQFNDVKEIYSVALARDATTGVVVAEHWFYQNEDGASLTRERSVLRNRDTGTIRSEKFYADNRLKRTKEFGPTRPATPIMPMRRRQQNAPNG